MEKKLTPDALGLPGPQQMQADFEREVVARYRGAIGWRSGAHLYRTGDSEAAVALCGAELYVPHRAPSWAHDRLCNGCRSVAAAEAKAALTVEYAAAAEARMRDEEAADADA